VRLTPVLTDNRILRFAERAISIGQQLAAGYSSSRFAFALLLCLAGYVILAPRKTSFGSYMGGRTYDYIRRCAPLRVVDSYWRFWRWPATAGFPRRMALLFPCRGSAEPNPASFLMPTARCMTS
jgi:hypothetical protein